MTAHKGLLVTLAKDLRQNASPEDCRKIEATLDAVDESYSELPLLMTPPSIDDRPACAGRSYPSFKRPYSTEEAIFVDDGQPIDSEMGRGYDSEYNIEQSSLREERKKVCNQNTGTRCQPSTERNAFHDIDASLYLSTRDLEVAVSVDPREYPPYQVAQRLLGHYTKTVHDWFPILPAVFIDQLERHYRTPLNVANTWSATLNLVCAIGAQHSFLVTTHEPGLDNETDEREDVMYLSKALLLLEVKEASLLTSLPDLAQVRCVGMLAFYYLAAGHVDRAWITIGIAIRLGMALGLHLEQDAETSLASEANNFALTWWSLRTLESLLGSITNRPTSIQVLHCSVALPRISALDDFASSTPMNLRAFLRISIVSQAALHTLYSVQAATKPWSRIQESMEKFKAALEQLLPVMSDRERLMLHFQWCDAMILVTRPCLGPRTSIDPDGKLSLRDQELAGRCIKAAQTTARLLPNEPDQHIFQNGPWWYLVHYIMRAVAVLLLSSSQKSLASLVEATEVTVSIKKLIAWLRWLQHKDTVAKRGLEVVLETMQHMKRDTHFTDVLEQQSLDLYRVALHVPGDVEMDVDSAHTQPSFKDWEKSLDPNDLYNHLQFQYQPTGTPAAFGNAFATNSKRGG
ncbi:hypothetical protein T440DRAFT_519698 [Plenodomus tracheiphilus IPT5]|uniref:Xylanolytic transcriptional activator regulatory domain-containing protein n=1 Tax=Plenodomus tracheiphilus IPT5 TaxID=1408161 RepID=A0A6A7B129_9PLEO|nr:hypothetical protein T440DRAFT_519698 [Plenodomus tracheiphilus IPT5]